MNKETFAMLMGWMASAYPNYELNKATMEVYYSMLEDLDEDALKAGAQKCVADSRFFPTVSDLRRETMALMPKLAEIPDKYTAWMNVGQKIIHWPARGDLHPITERAVKAIGGWYLLRHSNNAVADRARFLEAHDLFSSQYREHYSELPALTEYRIKLLTKPEGANDLRD